MGAKLTIKIYGGKYHITTSEDPDYVQRLAHEMDREVVSFMNRERGASLPQALVLLALSYLDSFVKAESASDNLRSQISGYLDEAGAVKSEADKLKAAVSKAKDETAKAKAENAKLKEQMDKLKEESDKIYAELGEALRRIEQLESDQPIAAIRT